MAGPGFGAGERVITVGETSALLLKTANSGLAQKCSPTLEVIGPHLVENQQNGQTAGPRGHGARGSTGRQFGRECGAVTPKADQTEHPWERRLAKSGDRENVTNVDRPLPTPFPKGQRMWVLPQKQFSYRCHDHAPLRTLWLGRRVWGELKGRPSQQNPRGTRGILRERRWMNNDQAVGNSPCRSLKVGREQRIKDCVDEIGNVVAAMPTPCWPGRLPLCLVATARLKDF